MTAPETYHPPPELSKFIASYGVMDISAGHRETYFSPPLAMSGFIINVNRDRGKVVSKIDGRHFFTQNAVATGQVTSPVYGELIGAVKSYMIFFRPTGMHSLFGNDLSELTNTSIPLSEFLEGKESEELYEQLSSRANREEEIQVLNNFFRKRIPAEEDKNFEAVLTYIHEQKGNVSIAEIERSSSYSRKTLERHFKKKVGLSPKVYCQIYQFKCLINFLQKNPGITWTQLAGNSGYFDQSHMSRYVKEYLQVSPNSIVDLDMHFINYLLNR